MKIVTYSMQKDDDGKAMLVKENSNYKPNITYMDSPDKVASAINEIFNADKLMEEHVWLVCLKADLRPVGFFDVSHGGTDSSVASSASIFTRVLLTGTKFFILVHNHPSGAVTPSASDVAMTKRVQEGADLLGLKLLDHVIVGENARYSFRESSEIIK